MFAHMKSLCISLNTVHSGCKPRSFMSSVTHFLHVFLFLPYISSLQSPPFYRPTHFYVPDAQTTSICHASPHLPHSVYPIQTLYKSTLHFLSFSNTAHIVFFILQESKCRSLSCEIDHGVDVSGDQIMLNINV
jgi:hypothetical protein